MSKTEKLLTKLRNGTIDGQELATLLGRVGWRHIRTNGSHQVWSDGTQTLVLVANRARLKPYQIKDAQEALLPKENL